MTEPTTTRRIALVPLLTGLVLGAVLAACARSRYESHEGHAGHAEPMVAAGTEMPRPAQDGDAGHDAHAGHDRDAGSDEHAGHDRDAGHVEPLSSDVPPPPPEHAVAAAPDVVVDLGNGNCPTMGGAVNGKTFTTWRNLRVGHCCPGCSEDFLASPEVMLDEVSPGWRDALIAVEKVNAASGASRAQLLTDLSARYTVVAPEKGAE